jgi:SNF2 family DNA or RNA helicase
MEFKPHKYQKPLIQSLKEKDHYGLFAFPGSGKTVMALEAIFHHRKRTLIIAPLSILYATWLNEHKKWDFANDLKISLLHGKEKDENFHKSAQVYLINPEGIPWLVAKIKSTKHFAFKTLIVDESVKFKSAKSKRFKELKKILKTFENRYILCGNPIPNHFADLWAQLYILDLGKRLGTSYYAFQNQYFYPTDYKRYNWALKPGAQNEIIHLLSDITAFVDIDSELGLPNRVTIDIPIRIPPIARKAYKDMERELFAILDDEESTSVLADNRTSALMKCWQIANGFIYTYDGEDKRITHSLHNELVTIAKEKVEELQGQPILIAYHFNEDEKRLKEAFPNAIFIGDGSEMQFIEKAWNTNKISILITQMNKISHGVNLQYGNGRTIMFYSLTYNYDTYDQLIRRMERQGSTHSSIIVIRLIAENTIHEAIIKTIESKGSMSSEFLQNLLNYRLNHQSNVSVK